MTYKRCVSCKVKRKANEYETFPTKNKGIGRRSKCVYCRKKERSASKGKVRTWYAKYKLSLKCEMCGYSKETHERFVPQALNFHHSQKNKEFCIARAVANNKPIHLIKKEIAKCTVLCNRCHAEIHNR